MREVTLKVTTNIAGVDGVVSDTIELTTVADYEYRDGIYILEYEESEVSGMEGSRTTIKVLDEKSVAVLRSGTSSTQLMYRQGEEVHSLYNTPYGSFDMIVNTKAVDVELESERLKKLSLDYNMELRGLTSTSSSMRIEIIE